MLSVAVLPAIHTKLPQDDILLPCESRRPPLPPRGFGYVRKSSVASPARGFPILRDAGEDITQQRTPSLSSIRRHSDRVRSNSTTPVGRSPSLPSATRVAEDVRAETPTLAPLRGGSLTPQCRASATRVVEDGRVGTPTLAPLRGGSLTPQCREKCMLQQVRERMAANEALVKAEQKAAKQRRTEELAQAEIAVTTYLQAQKETEDTVSTVLKMLKADKQLLKAGGSPDVNQPLVDQFRQKAKRNDFEADLRRYFPGWQLSDPQISEVIDEIVAACSRTVLNALLRGQEHGSSAGEVSRAAAMIYSDAMDAVLSRGSEKFQCSICFDPLVKKTYRGIDSSNMWLAKPQKTEHWSKLPCNHAFCRSCMTSWAETAINDLHHQIRCPAEGCKYCLWDQDIRELVSQEVFERHQEHKNADYLRNLKDAMKGDVRLIAWMKSHCRPCPDCHVIVSRSEGCDHMMCVCGSRFCYACGCKKCCCGKKHRSIWNPQTQNA